MRPQIGRLWQRRQADITPAPDSMAGSDTDDVVSAELPGEPVASLDAEDGAPEQPVILRSAGVTRKVHVGDVLPPKRPGWPRNLVRLPTVPKRAILAAGVCAGMVAPTLARHLALRMLLGPGGTPAGGPAPGTFEITRIVYHGPLTTEAMSTIFKALTSGRR